jgi:hypothetical protein
VADDDSQQRTPLPTEGEMFRVVVGVGLALLPILLVSVLFGPGWAALVLGFEVGIAIGVWISRRRSRS